MQSIPNYVERVKAYRESAGVGLHTATRAVKLAYIEESLRDVPMAPELRNAILLLADILKTL